MKPGRTFADVILRRAESLPKDPTQAAAAVQQRESLTPHWAVWTPADGIDPVSS